jgi:long-chain-fatty-acid--CoA ligase ACSBG
MCDFSYQDGVLPRNWRIWTWQQYYDECTAFAKSLIHLKVASFKTVNIVGFNSPEWLIANNGAILASCIAAGIYTTNSPEACQYISEHSQAEVIVLEDNKQLKKYAAIAKNLANVKAIVVWSEPVDEKLAEQCGKPVFSWSEFMLLGVSVSDQDVENRQAYVKPGHCSTLIYTSGTTGPPKAVMISVRGDDYICTNCIAYAYFVMQGIIFD